MIEQVEGSSAVFPTQDDLASQPKGFYLRFEEVLGKWEDGPPRRFFFGHYTAAVRALLPKDYRVASILRNPIQRSISRIQLEAKIEGRSVSELLADATFVQTAIGDFQTRMFGVVLAEGVSRPQDVGPADDAMLARAIERLDSLDFVGVTDMYETSIQTFDRTFGTHIAGSLRHVNQAPRGDVDQAELEGFFAPLVERDQELVVHARRRLEKLRRASSRKWFTR